MTLILENGTGVAGANAYVDPAFVLAYLTDRNRQTENGWTNPSGVEEDAACIEATDYIEARFRDLFKGIKQYRNIAFARSTLSMPTNPADTQTVTVGTKVYRFVDTLVQENDVQRAGNASTSIGNLVKAINLLGTSGTDYHEDTTVNEDATAENFIDDTMVAFAKVAGTASNSVATTTTVTGASWNFSTLTGGSDNTYAQPLSFPRTGLFDRDGNQIIGMPDRLKFAAAEYAVRARLSTSTLMPDPTIDPRGGVVSGVREKVGPIETSTQYVPGTASGHTLPPYPAADRLLFDYIDNSGGVIR